MNNIEAITNKINHIFIDIGCEKILINNEYVYKYNNDYYKIEYIAGFNSIVIEYAVGFENAMNKLYEDGDAYSLLIDEEVLLQDIKEDLLKYYINGTVNNFV